jgi:hypothetical protein
VEDLEIMLAISLITLLWNPHIILFVTVTILGTFGFMQHHNYVAKDLGMICKDRSFLTSSTYKLVEIPEQGTKVIHFTTGFPSSPLIAHF